MVNVTESGSENLEYPEICFITCFRMLRIYGVKKNIRRKKHFFFTIIIPNKLEN